MSKETKLNQIRLTLKKIVVWYFYGDEEDRRETEPVNFIFTIPYHIPLHKIIFMTHPISPSQVKWAFFVIIKSRGALLYLTLQISMVYGYRKECGSKKCTMNIETGINYVFWKKVTDERIFKDKTFVRIFHRVVLQDPWRVLKDDIVVSYHKKKRAPCILIVIWRQSDVIMDFFVIVDIKYNIIWLIC